MTSADLIAELQAARPTADPSLLQQVRAIAAAPPARRPSPFSRLSRLSPGRLALIVVPATAVVLLGVAGTVGVLDSGSPPAVTAARESLGHAAAPPSTETPVPQLKAGASADGSTPAPTPGRAQRYSAQLTLSVKDADALSQATQQALQITRDLGGHLVTVSYATSDTGVSSLTLKVPTANVQDAIVRFTGLGTIVSQQVQIDDLQDQVDELTKRETTLRGQIARLSARLADPNLDVETRATLEARRDAAKRALSSVRVARAQVNAEARYATIQLTLQTAQSSVVPVAPSRWDDAVDHAGEILALEATVVLYALVVLGPLALVALLAWLGRRTLRRRQDEQLLSAR
jgi:cell division protein FtsB